MIQRQAVGRPWQRAKSSRDPGSVKKKRKFGHGACVMPKFWLIFQVAQAIIVFLYCSLEKTSQKLGIAYPIFRFFFSWGQEGEFRALRSATAVSSAAPEKLLKKFYQNLQKWV